MPDADIIKNRRNRQRPPNITVMYETLPQNQVTDSEALLHRVRPLEPGEYSDFPNPDTSKIRIVDRPVQELKIKYSQNTVLIYPYGYETPILPKPDHSNESILDLKIDAGGTFFRIDFLDGTNMFTPVTLAQSRVYRYLTGSIMLEIQTAYSKTVPLRIILLSDDLTDQKDQLEFVRAITGDRKNNLKDYPAPVRAGYNKLRTILGLLKAGKSKTDIEKLDQNIHEWI
jgi:hypothetical protein